MYIDSILFDLFAISTDISKNENKTRTSVTDKRSGLFLHFLNPKTRPIITPDTTRTDAAAIITITARRLNKKRKKK